MQIILVHQRLAQARTLTITPKVLALAALCFITLVLACSSLVSMLTVRYADDINVPVLREMVHWATSVNDSERKEKYLREDLNAMAIKLGEMQAQLMRLDALGERVSGLAGMPQQEVSNFKLPPARGGLEPTQHSDISLGNFQSRLQELAANLEQRSDSLNLVESELMSAKLRSKMMPTIQPVNVGYNASGFGWRIDPITGQQAKHEGIDFVAQTGTPIVAAAGGVVIAAEWHNDFGNMVEIDHGNDISTVYAHTSRVYVKVGDVVQRNQHIADVGSTGRSTGSHLHFEVHVKGIPQNPAKFLAFRGATIREQVAALDRIAPEQRH